VVTPAVTVVSGMGSTNAKTAPITRAAPNTEKNTRNGFDTDDVYHFAKETSPP
jgi:hypothetical protein